MFDVVAGDDGVPTFVDMVEVLDELVDECRDNSTKFVVVGEWEWMCDGDVSVFLYVYGDRAIELGGKLVDGSLEVCDGCRGWFGGGWVGLRAGFGNRFEGV